MRFKPQGSEIPLPLRQLPAYAVQRLMDRIPQLSRRRAILLAVLAFAVALCGYASWVRLSEPRYQGKRVSVWFQEYCNLRLTSGGYSISRGGRRIIVNNAEVPDPAQDALVAMGESAAAYLGRQVTTRNMLNVPLYCRIYTNASISLRNILPDPYAAEAKRVDAAMALVSFGSKAQKEVPAIIDLAIKQPGYTTAMLLGVLPYFDVPRSESERLLNALVQQARYSDARRAVDLLKLRSPLAAMAVAEILAKSGSTDIWPFERLREMDSDAVVALPSLLRMITSTNSEVRYQVVRTLVTIGPPAAEALPAMLACSTDESSMVESGA
jgi:hypothetical protein